MAQATDRSVVTIRPPAAEDSIASQEYQSAWLARCVPIIVQPEHDIKLGHPLVKIYYSFCQDSKNGEALCELILVYEGEASYRRLRPLHMNRFATFFYMSFNRLVWGRTADIKYLTITGVDFRALHSLDVLPWRSIRTRDHCGAQTFSQGAKGNLGTWLSLFYHYTEDLPHSVWEKHGENSHRPLVYVNTANHLMGETNLNPDLSLFVWLEVLVEQGGRQEAEVFVRKSIRQKPVLWNPFPSMFKKAT